MVRASSTDARTIGRSSLHVPQGGDQGPDGGITPPNWPGNALGSPRRKLLMFLGRGKFRAPSWSCCPLDLPPDKRLTMDGFYSRVQSALRQSDNNQSGTPMTEATWQDN